MLERFPEAKPVCSAITARQLKSFGVNNELIVKASGESLDLDGFSLQFFSYPFTG